MGKGARSRANTAVVKAEQKVKEAEEAKKKRTKKLAVIITSLVLVAAVAGGGIFYGVFYGSGKYLRDNVVMSTENFKVDNAMMTYFFKSTFRNLQSTYISMFGDFEGATGVDTKKSLKGQDYQDGQTWFDSVLTSTKTSVESILGMAEAAKAESLELSEIDNKSIEKGIERLDSYFFTNGVSKDDVRKSMEIAALAQKYSNKFEDETNYTTEEIEKYYGENKNKYRTAGYRSYAVNYNETEEEGITPYTAEEAKAKADELKAATTEEKFVEIVTDAIKHREAAIEDETLTTQVDGTLNDSVSFTEDDEVSTWAFDDARKAGDTYVKANEEGKTYTVYFMTSPAARDESETVNLRHILLSSSALGSTEEAQKKAEEVKALFDADATEDKFAELALEYSDDQGSKNKGGAYTGIKKGDMPAEIETWILDSARKPGDTEIIKTESGSHFVYFTGEGRPYWQENISTDMKNEAFTEKTDKFKETYPVTAVDGPLQDIPA